METEEDDEEVVENDSEVRFTGHNGKYNQYLKIK